MTGFDIWNELGNIYFKVGAFDEAIDAYNKAIELDFRIGWLYSNLGFAYAHKGKFAEAIPVYEKSIELFNSNQDKAVSWSRLADAYRQLNQYEAALQAYQKAVELDPHDISFSAGLSAVQRQMGPGVPVEVTQAPVGMESEEAEESPAAEALILADMDAQDYFSASDAENDMIVAGAVSRLFEEEVIPAALSSGADLIQADEDPAAEELLEEIAPAVMEIVGAAPSPEPGFPDHAPDEINVLETVPEEIGPVSEMEMDLSLEPDAEIPSVLLALEQDELDITAVNSLLTSGIELWRKGDHEKAGEILQTALEAARKAENKWLEALSHNALALVKTEMGKLEEAIGSYVQAMQLAPEKIIPWNNIGHLYSRLDRNNEAMEAFLKAIEHNPEDFISWDGLGDIYAKSGRLNDGIAAYQLGNAFGKQRRAEDALMAYQMIIEPETERVLEKPANVAWVPEIPETIEPQVNEELTQVNNTLVEETFTETIGIDINDAAQEVAGAILSDQVLTETANETISPMDETTAVEEVLTVSDETQAQDVAAAEEILSAISEIVNETVPNENISVAAETVQMTDEIMEEDFEETLLANPQISEELAGSDDVVSLTSGWDQTEQVVSASLVEAEAQAHIPELVDEIIAAEDDFIAEIQPELEDAVSIEETVGNEIEAQMQAEQESLDDASSSIELSRLTSAIAAYKKVTEINPENDRAWDSLGNLYRASERHGDAISAFERAISLRPNKEVYYYHLGLVYAAEKHFEEAIQAFQKVIELNPDYTFAHCALAGYFRKLGMETEAQQHIEKALPKMTSEKEYDRACFSAICGNADEAIELLKIALAKKQTSLDWVRRDPDLDFIRDDQRFKALLSQNGSWSERLSDVFLKQLAWSPDK